ncbi:MAG: MBL fold metallo-hydrolase [Nanoarchaeota archaeon]|nr:MBL fold metallo-hydrolase [Nanoarchaeota archaeon]
MIKITILHNEYEEWREDSGFSVLIEAFGKKILFDTSLKEEIVKNSQKARIELNNVDFIVLSHGHFDHTDGLKHLTGTKAVVIAHPNCFEKKYFNSEYIGCPFSLEEVKSKFKVVLSKKPYWINKHILFLGEIPRKNNFENKAVGMLENGKPDYLKDDSALVILTKKGIVIITGCSHSGICNIINYAKDITKEKKIYAILGGFHLLEDDIQLVKTIECFKKLKPKKIFPAHCLSKKAFREFEKIGGKRIRTLEVIGL